MSSNKDKIKHFLIVLVLTLLVFWLIKNEIITILAVLLLGLIKELIDQIRGKNTAKELVLDLLANVLGMGAGFLIIESMLRIR